MSDAIALALRDVTMHFGRIAALTDASMDVRPGTIHSLLGENGAGKTTLMRIAFGMIKADRGDVLINGVSREFHSPAGAIAAGVGMVQQHPQNVAAMTVWENVLLGGHGRLSRRESRRRVSVLGEAAGFKLDPDARAGDLPVAAQQRLEILKAMDRGARILILDEPTAVLAPSEARDLYGWLRKFANGGGAVVVITHKLDEARLYTDDLTVLRQGRNVLTANSAAVTAPELTVAMIGEGLAKPAVGSPARLPGTVVLKARALIVRNENGSDAIKDASFDILTGEIVGIAGVEGSGHHELLLAIAGRHPISGGTLDAPSRVAIVPEDRHRDAIVPDFDLTENIAIAGSGSRSGRIDWKAAAVRARAIVTQFDVRAPGVGTPMSSLSGGNQQKLVLARALSDAPALLVAENPTRGLDVRATAFIRDRLREAAGSGMAVVFYSSDLDEIVAVADRVLVVHSGRVIESAMDRTKIGSAMLGAS